MNWRSSYGARRQAPNATFSRTMPAQSDRRCAVYGTKNTAFVDYMARTVVLERKADISVSSGPAVPSVPGREGLSAAGTDECEPAFSRALPFLRWHAPFAERVLSLQLKMILLRRFPMVKILRVSAIMERIFEQVYPEVRA